jgi:hypothetical protein
MGAGIFFALFVALAETDLRESGLRLGDNYA